MGLENSRRFRALPVYAVLLAYGKFGFGEIFAGQVRLARAVAKFLDSKDGYELLPQGVIPENQRPNGGPSFDDTHIIVLFRAKDDKTNNELVSRINSTRKIYVSGTKWDSKPACRIAVSTWKIETEKHLELILAVLEGALQEREGIQSDDDR